MAANPVVLDSESVWASFTINGQEFECEIYEAHDWLGKIDLAHRYDPFTCLVCHKDHTPEDEEFGSPDNYTCPHCDATGADNIVPSQEFLDDVGELLKRKFSLKRIARREAAKFYNAIVDSVREAQKKTTPSPESDSGSTLTPDY